MQSLVNVDERTDKNWSHEKIALNRNVFNNQRRNVSPLNHIQEEQKENLNDDQCDSSQISMRDLTDSNS